MVLRYAQDAALVFDRKNAFQGGIVIETKAEALPINLIEALFRNCHCKAYSVAREGTRTAVFVTQDGDKFTFILKPKELRWTVLHEHRKVLVTKRDRIGGGKPLPLLDAGTTYTLDTRDRGPLLPKLEEKIRAFQAGSEEGRQRQLQLHSDVDE